VGKRQPHESKRTSRPQPIGTPKPLQEKIEKIIPRREWEIKKVMERYGLLRGLAEKMVDEFGGRG
jgi:hypothetical protein